MSFNSFIEERIAASLRFLMLLNVKKTKQQQHKSPYIFFPFFLYYVFFVFFVLRAIHFFNN